MLAPVHDADDDGACVGSDLDEIEAGIGRDPACFFDGNDADLFAVGTDESDGAQTDLLVDPYLVLDQTSPPCKPGRAKHLRTGALTRPNITSGRREAKAVLYPG